MLNESGLSQYCSDIELEDSYDECEHSEVVQLDEELENSTLDSGWMKLRTSPVPSVTQDSDSWGYATSREVAMQQLQLRQQFVQMVKDRGCPFPELSKLAPGICKVHLMFIPRLSCIGTTLLIYVSFFCLHTTQPLFVVGIGLRLVLMDLAII